MVVTQRSEFAAVLRRHGLQGLIEVVRAHDLKLPAAASSSSAG